MVQRTVHGSQAGHVQPEKLLGNMKKMNKKKLTSCQNQDGKNMGSDMKKKMKRTSSIRKSMSQTGKTLPFNGQNGEATPRKQLMIRASDGSPNYMKSTSCSEARKERSQVSCSLNTQLGSDSKNLRMSNSSQSKLGSIAKPSRTLTKASSLKLVRTLTKAPSFKPVRGTARKSSRVLFCSDVNVQKATCSATQKESKFPAYLMLNPGGTESEGTSAIKVCPYTYCSLNGHHHSPLPPLKCFLKARRRSLKTQKSMKSEDASPRKFNPSSGRGCPEDKPALSEAGSIDMVNSPVTGDVDMDFFVEIYANNKVDDAESTQVSTTEFAGKPEEQKNKSDGSPLLPIDLEERFERCQQTFATIQEQEIKDEVEESSPTWLEEGAADGGFDRKETERECYTSMEEDDNISEVTNMEWEEDQLPVPELYSEAEHHNIAYLPAMEKGLLFYKLDVTNHDEIVSNYTGKVLIDDHLQELYEEETSSFDLHGVDRNTELESVQQEIDIVESAQMNSGNVESCDQISFVEEAVEELESDMQATPIPLMESNSGAAAAHASTQGDEVHEKENDNVESNDELENPETYCMNDLKIGTLDRDQEDISLQPDDATMLNDILVIDHRTETGTIAFSSLDHELPEIEVEDAIEEHEKMGDVKSSFGSQNSDSSHNFSEAEEDDTEAVGDSELYNILSPESMPTDVLNVAENQNLLEEDQDGVCKLKIQREQNSDLRMYKVILINENRADEMKGEESFMSDIAQTLLTDKNRTRSKSDQELLSACNKRKWTIQSKKPIKESEEERKFNPRQPNFLPVIPDPEAEKVDLKHQDMDDRKNSEEWMLDYALQKAVTKLAPARKKRVALLVEAFETVLPIPQCPTHIRNRSTAFPHSRPMQACS
ncbi:hypothetical protein K2173_005170 [Erythroxylum novogranatense]|uniref:Calmodulin-binding domain-containing protein n=1 Tax=Erythroxylum novogranatense TaxID=1862640 RepID=A0AAV8TRG3_9ROSI|nr:hypothetical protein K2173_005170 [Erythroxylum novogranatense]